MRHCGKRRLAYLVWLVSWTGACSGGKTTTISLPRLLDPPPLEVPREARQPSDQSLCPGKFEVCLDATVATARALYVQALQTWAQEAWILCGPAVAK